MGYYNLAHLASFMHLRVRAHVMPTILTSMASIHHRWMFMHGRALAKDYQEKMVDYMDP